MCTKNIKFIFCSYINKQFVYKTLLLRSMKENYLCILQKYKIRNI